MGEVGFAQELVIGVIRLHMFCEDRWELKSTGVFLCASNRLLQLLGDWQDYGSIIIFVNKQIEADELFAELLKVRR